MTERKGAGAPSPGGGPDRPFAWRHESFGGIIASEDPPLLAFVDRQYMRELGLGESERWREDPAEAGKGEGGDGRIGRLSAPVEVHFACTDRCSMGCAHCYMGSGAAGSRELGTAEFKRALGELARMGVFHVALGGGEALERPDIFELAAHARSVGLVPNLTTNGRLVDRETAGRMKVFGQVNVSLDGVGDLARVFRGGADFESVDRALGLLLEAGVSAGINCVVGRVNFEGLPELFRYAAGRDASEVELLRFKPSGRAVGLYSASCTTAEQNRELFPSFQRWSEEHGVKTKIDCSFVPMLCWHRPPIELLESLCVCGCEAGNFLVGARSDGRVAGCSFLPALELGVDRLAEAWDGSPELERYRRWTDSAPEPCAACDYLRLCKGGCHAVALAVSGSVDAPDPDCPWVVEHRAKG